jgi:hypothetical protein
MGDGFTSPKESVLWIFIALKNSLPSAGIESANLRSNGKHASHYSKRTISIALTSRITETIFIGTRTQ